MGKSRKSRKTARSRDDPVGLDSAILELENGMKEQFDTNGENKIVTNIIAQLQSVNPEDRICGCHSLAKLSGNGEVKAAVLELKVARICGPLLIDKDYLVVQAAAGCLHNLSCEGGEVVEQLVDQDIITPLITLMDQFRGIGNGLLEGKKERTLVDCFGLLWNVLEQNQTATEIFNRQNLIEIVVQFLDISRFSPSLVLASLSLLATACDNNPPAQEKMYSHADSLLNLLQSEATSHHIKVTAGVVLVNMFRSEVFENRAFAIVMSAVSECLLMDTRKLVCDWSSSSPIEEDGQMDIEGGEKTESEDIAFKNCMESMRAQIAALEIVANLSSPEDEDAFEGTSDDSDDDLSESEMSAGLEMSRANPVFVGAVLSYQIVETILQRANDVPVNVRGILSSTRKGRTMLNQFKQLVVRCFFCLSNLVDSLSLVELGGSESLYLTWTGLGRICCQSQENDYLVEEELMEAATSTMRACTAKLCGDSSSFNLFKLGPSDLDQLVAVYSHPKATIRTNIVNILGDLACLASKNLSHSSSRQVLSVLALWLVDNAGKDEDLRVVAEALDKLFDIFGEDDSDEIFAELKLLQKLNNILPQLKSKITQNKKKLGEDLPIINMAKANLQRFVKYKEKRPMIKT